MKKQTFTINELCEILNLQRASIRLKIKKGELKAFKTGRDWIVSVEEFKKYLRDAIRDDVGFVFMSQRVDDYLSQIEFDAWQSERKSPLEERIAQYESTVNENTATPETTTTVAPVEDRLPQRESIAIDKVATPETTTVNDTKKTTPVTAKKSTATDTKATTPVVATFDNNDDPVKVAIVPSTMIEFLKKYEMQYVGNVDEIVAMIKSEVLISMKNACEMLNCSRSQLSRYETKYLHAFRFFLSDSTKAQFQCFYFAKEVEELAKIPTNQRRVDPIVAPVFKINHDLQRQIDNGELIYLNKKEKNIEGRNIEFFYKEIRLNRLRAIRINHGGRVSTYVYKNEVDNLKS